MTWTMLLLLALVMIVGAILLRLGLRGKRINNHPVCRQCRFDLIGQPEPLTTCPECGSGLRRPGWVRIGQRRRMPIIACVGALLLLMPGLLIASAVAVVATGSNLDKHTPTSVLLWQARHMSSSRLGAIADELESRMSAGKMKKDELGRAAAVALEIQANERLPWTEKWGDIIEQAHTDDAISKEQWKDFCDHAILLEVRARPRVRAGDAVPIEASVRSMRVGSSTTLIAASGWRGCRFAEGVRDVGAGGAHPARIGKAIDKIDVAIGLTSGTGTIFASGSAASRRFSNRTDVLGGSVPIVSTDLVPRYVLGVEAVVEAQSLQGSNSWGDVARSKDAAHHYAEFAVDIVPRDQDTIEIVNPDDAMREQMEAFVRMDKFLIQHSDQNGREWRNASISLPTSGAPCPFAFEVYYRTADGEHRVGALTSSSHGVMLRSSPAWPPYEGKASVGMNVPEFTDATVDLIFRPSPEIARATIDLTRMYGGEIVVKDVPVEDYEMRSGAGPVRRKPSSSNP